MTSAIGVLFWTHLVLTRVCNESGTSTVSRFIGSGGGVMPIEFIVAANASAALGLLLGGLPLKDASFFIE